MSRRFEELDHQETPMGPVTLRRRFDAVLEADVFEVKLGEEFLMSSAFTVAEEELARLVLARLAEPPERGWQVLVGGLGLGYTAQAALEDERVGAVTVLDAVEQVIDWHRRELLPASAGLVADPRLALVHADFFAAVAGRQTTDAVGAPALSGAGYDAVLLDIDHTPHHLLNESHRDFYTVEGLSAMEAHLLPGGVLGIWSDDPPDEAFLDLLRQVYVDVAGEVVAFANRYTGGESTNTVYLARRR
ncbi:spermidine synthase [Nocardioides mesophilus]|uniref:Spermidine synthase n=1 Tax=Nocardioides mesophilus TaxID=433659 RepID=A0A7G9REU3_9ACTN|nr:spermidine synthase [Nocardioides mesophilus]QNN54118.1 spermidine synthase [Nocardioides mesophilus]